MCVFANLVLYLSGSDRNEFPSTPTMWGNADPNLQHAVEGDVIQLYHDSTEGFRTDHVAIVIQIYRTGGTITALDVIDSNYLTDMTSPSTGEREIIGRHAFCTMAQSCPFSNVQMIQGHYRIWKGPAYYSTSYDPNGVSAPTLVKGEVK